MIGRIVFFIAALFFTTVHGQDITVRGSFLSDSVQVGQPVPYALSVSYPSGLNILLPDSTADFGGFEYRYRKWFPTHTSRGVSRDSAIYWVSTFELDSIQSLRLEAIELSGVDTLFHTANPDSIGLSQVTGEVPPQINAKDLPLLSDTGYWDVRMLFNYPVWTLAGGIFIVVLAVCWIIFGNAIRRYFRRRRLSAGFNRFAEQFSGLLDQLKRNPSSGTAETLVALWKAYMEQLEQRPYRKLTSLEITTIADHRPLTAPLEAADRLIYGGIRPSSVDSFHELKSFSEDRLHQQLEALRHPERKNQ